MAGFNQIIIIGNVGRDPETRFTQAGVQVTSFSVAVTRKFGSGENRQEETQWMRVSCWNKLAETANQWIKKGMQVQVVGSVSASAYIDKATGEAKASLEIRADNFTMLGSRADNGAASGASDEGGSTGGSNVDEIPF